MTLRSWAVLVALSGCCNAQVTIQSVLNGASFSGAAAPGTWVAIFGSGLSTSTVQAAAVPLPTQLGGVSVTFGGVAAPLNYVSPGQINAIILRLTRNAPALFTKSGTGSGAVLAFDAAFQPVATATNTPIVLYATGLGPTLPGTLNMVQDNLNVYVGDAKATVEFAGLAPGLPGVYQLNVRPNGPISDRVYLQQGGWQSNIASLPMTPGSNVANVSGSIDGLYPATGANVAVLGGLPQQPAASSIMFMAATFAVDFDILPGARPFSVVAATDAASAVINIDPVRNLYQATYPTPTQFEDAGDFSSIPFTLLNFASCTTEGCLPFAGNILPVSVTDPVLRQILRYIPAPNQAGTAADGVNGTLFMSGPLPAGGHFSISSTSQSQLGAFGAFFQIARPGGLSRTATFSLYVDGVLVAGKKAPYTLE